MDNKSDQTFKAPNFSNWETANKELSSTFQGSLNSWMPSNNSIEGFSNLPVAESQNETTSQVNNNFNVNVNVNGNVAPNKTASVQTEAQRVVNNVLNVSTPPTNPQDLKKNYNIPFGASLNDVNTSGLEDFGLKPITPTLNIPELQSNSTAPSQTNTPSTKNTSIPNTQTPIQNKTDTTDNFAKKAFEMPSPVNIMHSYMNAEEGGAFLPGLNNQSLSFDSPNMTHYTYSIAQLKENNPKIKKNYDFIKNIIHKTLGEVSSNEMKQADKNERFVTETENYNRFISQQNLYLESGDTNLDKIEQITREFHQNSHRTQNEADKTMIEIGRNIGRRKSEDQQLNDEMNGDSDFELNLPDMDEPTTTIEKNRDLQFSHINDFENLLMMTELNEINKPPVWRSVLG